MGRGRITNTNMSKKINEATNKLFRKSYNGEDE
jgi:hypothetical protein